MRQERLGGAVGHRPARAPCGGRAAGSSRSPAARRACPSRCVDAADFLDLGARHRLMIGDDGERLDRGARQFPRHDRFMGQQPGQIARGAQRPFAADANEIDAARRIFASATAERARARRRRPAGAWPAAFSSSGASAANSSASRMRNSSARVLPPILPPPRLFDRRSRAFPRRSPLAQSPLYPFAGIPAVDATRSTGCLRRFRR